MEWSGLDYEIIDELSIKVKNTKKQKKKLEKVKELAQRRVRPNRLANGFN